MGLRPVHLPTGIAEIPHVAVGVKPSGRVQNHAGIFYRDARGRMWLMDFTTSGAIESRLVTDAQGFAWCVPQVSADRLRYIARYCESLSAVPSRLRYGFKLTDLTRVRIRAGNAEADNAIGFTCATFVLGIFQTRRAPLVATGTWEYDPDDEAWQRRMQELMVSTAYFFPQPLSDEAKAHIASSRAEITGVRFRPQDVLGAARTDVLPADFRKARPLGEEVHRWLRSPTYPER